MPKLQSPRGTKQVVVFHQHGCPACANYLPRFRRIAVEYRGVIHVQTANMSTRDPVLLRRIVTAADRYKIKGAPTTVVLDADDQLIRRVVGAVPNAEIRKLFEFAVR